MGNTSGTKCLDTDTLLVLLINVFIKQTQLEIMQNDEWKEKKNKTKKHQLYL